MKLENVTVIGLGGIWSYFWPILCRTMVYQKGMPRELVLWDGDEFTKDNMPRQDMFEEDENKPKAEVYADRIKRAFPDLAVLPQSKFVTKKNIEDAIKDNMLSFLFVDNAATKLLVSQQAAKRKNIILVHGGNEMWDGNVQVYARFDGDDITQKLEQTHPEIATPKDKNPGELSCEERARLPGGGQLAVTNMMVAAWAATYVTQIMEDIPHGKEVMAQNLKAVGEVFFDAKKKSALAYNRGVSGFAKKKMVARK